MFEFIAHHFTPEGGASEVQKRRPRTKEMAHKSGYSRRPRPLSPWEQRLFLAEVQALAADGSTSGTDSLSSKNSESSHPQTDRDRATEGELINTFEFIAN